MNTIKFNKELYPKEIVLQCINDYKKYLNVEFEENDRYSIIRYPKSEENIALEFNNYVIAMVRANTRC